MSKQTRSTLFGCVLICFAAFGVVFLLVYLADQLSWRLLTSGLLTLAAYGSGILIGRSQCPKGIDK